MDQFLILILMLGALYYLLLRPQQKREKARRELVRALQPGDEVVSNAGIHGVIAEVEDTVVWLEVAPEVELKVSRDAISGRAPGAQEPDDSADEDDDAEDDTEDDA